MVLSSLVAMLMASVIHLHHLQVPVVTGQDVAVAQVITPTGASPDWKVSVIGLPREALQNYYVENGLLYVNISTEKTPRLDRTFALMVRASGFQIEETGLNEHRLARRVRSEGDAGVKAYRIPGLVTTPKGTLVATYDIRHNSSFDLSEDIDIGIRPQALLDPGEVLVYASRGRPDLTECDAHESVMPCRDITVPMASCGQ